MEAIFSLNKEEIVMKKTILFTAICLIPASLFAMNQINDSSMKKNFAKIVRLNNFECNSCSDAYFVKEVNGQRVFKVLCNDDFYEYKVTTTPTNNFLVEPWDW